MRRSTLAAAGAALLVAAAVASFALWRCAATRGDRGATDARGRDGMVEASAVALLERIPTYRQLARTPALRVARVDGRGILHVEVDLRAVVEPRLAAMGFPGASELLPRSARGTIALGSAGGVPMSGELSESWRFDGPAAALELLDRSPAGRAATAALDAIPGEPTALLRVRLRPQSLADPRFGGAALASWRDRADFAEKLLGRPLRAEIAEDLAGPAVFALYEGSDENEAEVIVAAELQRADRLSSVLDMVFGLGALTERATIRRYRGVPTGSFVASSGGPGLALAVDGPILLVATSRARLESAIDARRAVARSSGAVALAGEPGASWNAVSASAFVRHGWARLARSPEDKIAPVAMRQTTIRIAAASAMSPALMPLQRRKVRRSIGASTLTRAP